MSIALLKELQQETRRLAIAGSELAGGDLKLQKILPALSRAGEKSPVFARVAQLVRQVTEPSSESQTDSFLELSMLLQSILVTQAETGKEGELDLGPVQPLPFGTHWSYRKLAPVIDALTSRGNGRLELLRETFESGWQPDVRLVEPLFVALQDPFSELADYVAEVPLPVYGHAILPLLKESLDLKGGKGDGRKLHLLHLLAGGSERETFETAMEQGSLDVKLAAIRILGLLPETENLLMACTKEKKKDIRCTAYTALAQQESEHAAQFLRDAINGKDQELVLEAILKSSPSSYLEQKLLEWGNELLDSIDQLPTEQEWKFHVILRHLHGKEDDASLAFIKRIMVTPGVPEDLVQGVAGMLLELDRKEGLEWVESLRDRLPRLAGYALEASVRLRNAEEVFSQYSHWVKRGRKDKKGKAILDVMDQMIHFDPPYLEWDEIYQQNKSRYEHRWNEYRINPDRYVAVPWDGRWIEIWMGLNEENLVYRAAKGTRVELVDYIKGKIAQNPSFTSKRSVASMICLLQIQAEEAPDVMLDVLAKTKVDQLKYHVHYVLHTVELLQFLPASHVSRLLEAAEAIQVQASIKAKLLAAAQAIENPVKE